MPKARHSKAEYWRSYRKSDKLVHVYSGENQKFQKGTAATAASPHITRPPHPPTSGQQKYYSVIIRPSVEAPLETCMSCIQFSTFAQKLSLNSY